MAVGQLKHAIGIFSTRQEAEYALHDLRETGFNMNQVSVIAKDASLNEQLGDSEVHKSTGEQVKGGAKAGATAGGTAGGLIGLIGSLGVLAIPGVGPAAEVGIILANTLIGGAIGAAGGGLLGALIGWGIPEEDARYYDERVSQGDYLVIAEGTDAEIRNIGTVFSNRGIRNWAVYDAPGTYANRGTGTRL
ncbi:MULTISPECIES: general stress protein [unclassified Coleofasciculus]|uniref:general stress protein n=1 Tax=unclassified Coleofasciculus TaxID=2692782 RepID=UPI001881EC5A|nr:MULTISPECIES: general stress protein [unclassified Coleofasciculus]MBE9128398.1 hypothetical protein [Coleofasciculus sp. LEGE 07081]MBE9150352.1 hypothetical protein [Coleofasciculus sp. LEGE 07092]